MKLTYTQPGAQPKVWSFKPRKMYSDEIEEIERRTGLTLDEWTEKLPPSKFSMLAVRGLLFILLRRDIPDLSWDSVRFTADEVAFELELDEKEQFVEMVRQQIAAGAVGADELDDVRRALAEVDKEIAEERGSGDEAPKAPPAPSSETVTGAHSATPGDGTRSLSGV